MMFAILMALLMQCFVFTLAQTDPVVTFPPPTTDAATTTDTNTEIGANEGAVLGVIGVILVCIIAYGCYKQRKTRGEAGRNYREQVNDAFNA